MILYHGVSALDCQGRRVANERDEDSGDDDRDSEDGMLFPYPLLVVEEM